MTWNKYWELFAEGIREGSVGPNWLFWVLGPRGIVL